MTTHSPAPWIFNGDVIVDVNGQPIAANPVPDTADGEARWQTDAPFIAAVPLLLEAVKGAIGEVEANSTADVLLNNAPMVAEGHVIGVNVDPLERRLRQMRSDLDTAIADRNAATARLQEVDEKLCGALNQLAAEKVRADDLSRMVAAMGEALVAARDALEPHTCDGGSGGCGCEGCNDVCAAIGDIDAIVSRPDVAAERGRWRKVEEYDAASAHAEKAYAAAEEAENDLGVIVEAIRTHFPHYVSVTDGEEFSPVETVEEVAREFKVLGQRIADVEADRRVVSAATYAQRAAERDEAYAERDAAIVRAEKAETETEEAVRRAESDELGCDIAYRREPTQEEGDAHEDKQHQSTDLPTGECFVAMGGWTGRRCRHCARWVWGGPTACAVCVERASRDELGIQLAACQERLRLAMACVVAGDALDVELSQADIVDGRLHVYDKRSAYQKARAALDAVPGDALATATKKDGE